MTFKALFLDFYGTVVHEDDEIIQTICTEIKDSAAEACTNKEIGHYWWETFSSLFVNSYGNSFDTQRNLVTISLNKTIQHFKSSCVADELVQKQFEHWQKPQIFEDSIAFFRSCELPIYIISNIDTSDVIAAIDHHQLKVSGVITSEDVRSYKPRSEIFIEALKAFKLESSEVLHIGDSLINDVVGAQNVNIRAAWINRMNKNIPDHIKPDYMIKSLTELNLIEELTTNHLQA